MTLGSELTFVPNKPGKWKEFLSYEEAVDTAAEFNDIIHVDPDCREHGLVARADTFRAAWMQDQPHESWCIEMSMKPVKSDWIVWGDASLKRALETLYSIAAGLSLFPRIRRGKREWPTGGGHLCVSTDIFTTGWQYHLDMLSFERSLYMDYANRPYIRWLFAQWSDDTNSNVVNAAILDAAHKAKKGDDLTGAIVNLLMGELHAIKQRSADTGGKACYPTYEFRFFDAADTPDVFFLQARFLIAWVEHHADLVASTGALKLVKQVSKAGLITSQRFAELAKPKVARREIEAFFSQIGIDTEAYLATLWDSHFMPRIKHGKLL